MVNISGEIPGGGFNPLESKNTGRMVNVLRGFLDQPENSGIFTQPKVRLDDLTGLLTRFAHSEWLDRWNDARAEVELSRCRLQPDFSHLKIQSLLLATMREKIPDFRVLVQKLRDGISGKELSTVLLSAVPSMALVKPDGLEQLTGEQIAAMVTVPIMLGVCDTLGGGASSTGDSVTSSAGERIKISDRYPRSIQSDKPIREYHTVLPSGRTPYSAPHSVGNPKQKPSDN